MISQIKEWNKELLADQEKICKDLIVFYEKQFGKDSANTDRLSKNIALLEDSLLHIRKKFAPYAANV